MSEPVLSAQELNVCATNLPVSWQRVKLAQVCELNPRRPTIERDAESLTTFVPMSAVAENGQGITAPAQRPFREVRKGYTYFADGDILFAKITPCMENGKHAIARNLVDGFGFGSTEFHVLRPRAETISEWLHFFVMQPEILHGATTHFTGTVGQQRVPVSYLAELDLPLPSIKEQRRIVCSLREQLEAVKEAQAALQAQLLFIHHLPASLLRNAFSGKT